MNNETKRTKISVQDMVQLSVLIAILLLLELTGLGMIKTAGLEITIMLVPDIVGANVMGPAAGALQGGVYGLLSFWECFGKSAFGVVLMGINPFLTFLVSVPTRILAGWICGLVFKGLSKLDKSRTWSYIVSAMCAPALNTLFFMGYIVLAFYNCDYVQNLVSVKGAANPLMFVVLLVGVQGVAEFLVSGILGGIVARAVHKFLK